MPHTENPRVKDCYEMAFLNCPQVNLIKELRNPLTKLPIYIK